MEDKRTRILETAIGLAERGGFDAVRLRDVAEGADVALGTLYKRFRSKEEILVAALTLEVEKLGRRMGQRPPDGATVVERVIQFFEIATRGLFRRPNLARALLRALTSGDAQLSHHVTAFHTQITSHIIAAMRGRPLTPGEEERSTEQMVAYILQQVWFAALVGWMGGMLSKQMVVEQVRVTLVMLLNGVDLEKEIL